MGQNIDMPRARFAIGEVVRHKMFDFRGVVFDVDPVFANSEEWYQAIPEPLRPSKDQPYYHLLAENSDSSYIAYVSQQNLVPDDSDEPVDHPAIAELFDLSNGRYELRPEQRH
jgi:heat shock protein HspQ